MKRKDKDIVYNLKNPTANRTNLYIRPSTEEFIEGVIKRVSQYKKSPVPVMDIKVIKMNSRKINTSYNNHNNVVEVINLDDDDECNEITTQERNQHLGILNESEVKEINRRDFLNNLNSNYKKNTNDENLFRCLICFRSKILIHTRILDCEHEFCNKCILKWLKIKNTCPICRKPVE
jgi:hypothetical protein